MLHTTPSKLPFIVFAVAGAACLLGCGDSTTTETETARGPAAETSGAEPGVEEGEPPPAQPTDPETIEGRILSTSPLGHGSCTQRSYEVEPTGDHAEAIWLHWEQCGEGSGPTYEALEVGESYRFTVERGASENYADGPMIVGAEAL